MDKIRINLSDILLCISDAQDLISPSLSKHHQQVAYLSYHIAANLKLTREQQRSIILAALVHDIGALSLKERLELIEEEPIHVNNHAFIGHKMLEGFTPLEGPARFIKYHHIPWNNGEGKFFMGEAVPYESHILHLADRTCALINSTQNIITALPGILEEIILQSGTNFDPRLVDALLTFEKKEYIWLDLISSSPASLLMNLGLFDTLVLEMDDIIDLTHILSYIIDFRSKFTSRHSAGVAATAEHLARIIGFSPYECKMMLVAGYLHDLGKIAISNEILEKNSVLDQNEFDEIRMHTYYTYRLLERIPQFTIINRWASYHHEKLNGTGYPFHIAGDNLGIGSRIMAVADIFTAIREDRPYRAGMRDENTKNVLKNMVTSGALDHNVVETLLEHYQEIDQKRETAQQAAAEHYNKFLELQMNYQ